MRNLTFAFALALAACAANPTPACCACSATRSQGFGFASFDQSVFVDTDHDGLPDTRLPDWGRSGLDAVHRAYAAVRAASDAQQLDAALAALATAVAEARARGSAAK